ncbi:SDR family NAD(P)-dependent oxidoreductase [Jiella sonneratiae]|uniref:SDR family oxidoreductase n=1 Tax=Jiella sonneratiae TaxID=2816856 RepID=A0ABS3J8B8_9HYPH|nr:SDR family NAD(P)-dependent oxidoreductase [Jiella sonneratiae]MBO0905910.1 SDR family oxidoreductase [Jiella sonneratiae]
MSGQSLAGRVALVTGASRNIGREIARAFAREGAAVLVHAARDLDAAKETVAAVEAEGARGLAVVADLADPKSAAILAEAAGERFGRLDVLVNNAAIRPEATIDDLTYEDWRQVMAVNLDSAFLVTKAVLPLLRKGEAAAICNIGGLTGHTGAPHRAHVIAAKAGLVGLTKALAHELSPQGITVNCVSPGLVDTRRAGGAPKHHDSRTNLVGRRGGADEIAAAVLYLCGPGARYVTGETLHVNGGAYLS